MESFCCYGFGSKVTTIASTSGRRTAILMSCGPVCRDSGGRRNSCANRSEPVSAISETPLDVNVRPIRKSISGGTWPRICLRVWGGSLSVPLVAKQQQEVTTLLTCGTSAVGTPTPRYPLLLIGTTKPITSFGKFLARKSNASVR